MVPLPGNWLAACIAGLTPDLKLFSGGLSAVLITFANSLDPDQDRQNVGPDLDPNRLTL